MKTESEIVQEDVERALCEILAEALGLEPEEIDPDLGFLEMGASSLVLVDTFRQLHERFQVRVSIRRVFEEFSNIDLLSGHVVQLIKARPALLESMEPVDEITFPLSSTQQQLCFLARYSDGASAAYNETQILKLTGTLDFERLQQAWAQVMARHDALRLKVSIDESEQVIGNAAAELRRIEVRGQKMGEIGAWLKKESGTVFNLNEAVVRAHLLALADQVHLLVVTVHTIAIDRPSLERVMEDLSRLYQDKDAKLSAATSYGTFVRYLEQWESGPQLDEAENFWLSRFSDQRPQVDLPTDFPRPTVKTYRGARLVAQLDADLAQQLEIFSRSHSSTLAMTMTAAFHVFLRRLSGQDDLVVGGLGQVDAPGENDLVANRANPLALCTTLKGETRFSDLLGEQRRTLLECFDAQNYPFARLIQKLNPARDQSRSTIFTNAFSVRSSSPAPQFSDLQVEPVACPISHTRYDFELEVLQGAGGLQLWCNYSTDLFHRDTIKRWVGYYKHLLAQLIQTPDATVDELELMSQQAKAELSSWQSASRDYPTGETIADRFEAQVEKSPDAIAIYDGADTLTYAQLDQRANQVANGLQDKGVTSGQLVGICMPRTADMVTAVLAVLKAGGTYVPLDPAYPTERIELVKEDAKLALIIESLDELQGSPTTRPLRKTSEDDLAYVIYTSGSTGRPKGVAIEHKAAVNFLYWAEETFSSAELAGVLFSTSICFDLSIFEMFAPLCVGGAVIVADNVLEFPGLHAAEKVTLVNTVPSAMRELLRLEGVPKSVLTINLAGEALHNELTDRVYRLTNVQRVYNLYGPSESTTYATYDLVARGNDEPVTIGRPVANTEVFVLDDQMRPVPAGAVGELHLGGKGLARGYLNRPALTERQFIDGGPKRGRLYRTGDLVRFGPDGRLSYLGRFDHQVKVRGYRIELEEIEIGLRAHAEITDAVATVREGSNQTLQITAHYVGAKPLDVSQLRAWLKQRLPEYMVPAYFICVEALPTLPNGKIDRSALAASSSESAPAPSGNHVAPRNPTEEVLAEIWADILSVPSVSVTADYFDLGGDSLSLAPLMVATWKTLGTRLSMKQFFEAPTIEGMARTVQRMRAGEVPREARNDANFDQASPAVQKRFDFLYDEARLDPDLRWDGPEWKPQSFAHVVLTGATGFVGSHLLEQLLAQSSAQIHCIVRCRDPEHGFSRIKRSLEYFELYDEEYADRIVAIPGDLAQPKMGLSDEDWQSLAKTVDTVVHNGAIVNFIYPYEALKGTNVDGTKTVIRFAFDTKLKAVHFISTVAVLPMGAQRRFEEDNSLDHRLQLNMAYDETKWVAEKMLLHAADVGLPVAIYRPGEVSGHSKTGFCIPQHFLYAVCAGSMQLEAMPHGQSMIDLTPVDYVAKAIVHIMQKESSIGKTFHLTNPNPKHSSWIYDWMHAAGYKFDLVALDDWRHQLLHSPEFTQNALYPYATVLDDLHEVHLNFPEFDCKQTLKELEGSDIACPPVDGELLATYLRFFVKVEFLIPPQNESTNPEFSLS